MNQSIRPTPKLAGKELAKIRLLVLDVDGVLTDGAIYVTDHGTEMKRFHVRDGLGIRLAMRAGLAVGVISGRATRSVTYRLAGLGIEHVIQGCSDKAVGLEQMCQRVGVAPREVAYLGDDLIDLPAMLRCGYPMAVANAVDEVRAAAAIVTKCDGGHGAVREAIEHLLRGAGKWDAIVASYRPA